MFSVSPTMIVRIFPFTTTSIRLFTPLCRSFQPEIEFHDTYSRTMTPTFPSDILQKDPYNGIILNANSIPPIYLTSTLTFATTRQNTRHSWRQKCVKGVWITHL